MQRYTACLTKVAALFRGQKNSNVVTMFLGGIYGTYEASVSLNRYYTSQICIIFIKKMGEKIFIISVRVL